MALGAEGNGGGALSGAVLLIRSPPTGAAIVTGIDGGWLEKVWAMTPLAVDVPSAPQTGQLTVTGIRPLTGSTSNLYFWPQPQATFTSINFLSESGGRLMELTRED
jgi:hypothetical protein